MTLRLKKIPELTKFFESIYRSTAQGRIAWEKTADSEILEAVLGEEYVLQLRLIPDLEGTTAEPDHEIALYHDRVLVLLLTRLDIDPSNLSPDLAEMQPYVLFDTLWERAAVYAADIYNHVGRAMKLLETKNRS